MSLVLFSSFVEICKRLGFGVGFFGFQNLYLFLILILWVVGFFDVVRLFNSSNQVFISFGFPQCSSFIRFASFAQKI